MALNQSKGQRDFEYLEKLQDYYAEHKVIPSYSVLAALWGISAKSWVSECVKRFEEAGFLDWTPDRQLKPGARFFERRLADSPVQAGLPNPAISDGYDLITIDDYLVRLQSFLMRDIPLGPAKDQRKKGRKRDEHRVRRMR